MPVIVEPVGPDLRSALKLLLGSLPSTECSAAVERAMELVRRGELDPGGVCVVRKQGTIVGAMLGVPAAGAAGLVWPPQAVECPERGVIEDALVHATLGWLKEHGAKLCQVLLRDEERRFGLPLVRNGFHQTTQLVFMRRWLTDRALPKEASSNLTLTPLSLCDEAEFKDTLGRTYEGTEDCPELNGVRTLDEVVAGHRAQGESDPAYWWLAKYQGTPAGVLLMNRMVDEPAWEVVYLGLTPEWRGRGWGRELVRHALVVAGDSGVHFVDLSVDARNVIARNLYEDMGFETAERRWVYLYLFSS